jgi:Outer membrane protein beta-barrel family/Carboxypeptidase regulatory-like domain
MNIFVEEINVMKKTGSLLLFCVFAALTVCAQKNGLVKGRVFDSLARQGVGSATITLLDSKDSSLVSFTMADNAGNFELRNLPDGDYRLLITHVNYHNSNTVFSITADQRSKDLGTVYAYDLTQTLSEVVVSNEAPPITMIKDTIQYNAGSFKVQPNANVEQLLRKLPGVKVDKDGTIRAQGEKVTRVMVDGKEFFGTDPKIATRNLPADAVDKVQVYDKQSEQAALTGFEDGNYEKTINLKLKKDKKKGVFGKLMAGAGTDDRFEARGNVNSFKGARQMSVIGMGNNTNAEGFSFMDLMNFSGEMARMRNNGSGNFNFNVSSDDPNAALFGLAGGNNNGINTTGGGGVNYNNIIGTKTDFQSNYFYSRYNPQTESHIQRQYFLPDSTYSYLQNSYNNNLNNNHRLNLNADFQLDSFHSVRISPSIGTQSTRNRGQSDYQTLSEEHILTNEGFSNTENNSEGFNFRNDLLFRKKTRRRGRTFSFSLQTSINSSEGNGLLNSLNSFYRSNGALIRRDTFNQKNNTESSLRSYNARMAYTEPVFKRSLVEFSLGKSNALSRSAKNTYDFNSSNGKYDELNDLLSNDFENSYGYNNAGIRFRTQKRKYNYSVGIRWQEAALEGRIFSGIKDSVIAKTFINWLPTASFQYSFTRFKTLRLNYNTSTNQPSVSQLQPVPDISNPLNIRLGNPDLKQEFTQLVQANFSWVSPFRAKNFFAFLNFTHTQNKIVNFDEVDTLGIKTTRPVNVNGVVNAVSDINWGFPVKLIKGTSFNLGNRMNWYRGKQFVNKAENTITVFSAGPDARLDMNLAKDKLNIGLSGRFNYYKTTYSLQSALNTEYLQQEYGTELNWQLPKNFYLSTDFTYTISSRRAQGFNLNVPLWNAACSKQFLKYNRGEVKLSVYDLLNQNVGISRNTNQNYIEDARTRILQRFFLLSFTYSLSKSGLGTATGGGVQVIRR